MLGWGRGRWVVAQILLFIHKTKLSCYTPPPPDALFKKLTPFIHMNQNFRLLEFLASQSWRIETYLYREATEGASGRMSRRGAKNFSPSGTGNERVKPELTSLCAMIIHSCAQAPSGLSSSSIWSTSSGSASGTAESSASGARVAND